jgi:hypothetical protein
MMTYWQTILIHVPRPFSSFTENWRLLEPLKTGSQNLLTRSSQCMLR